MPSVPRAFLLSTIGVTLAGVLTACGAATAAHLEPAANTSAQATPVATKAPTSASPKPASPRTVAPAKRTPAPARAKASVQNATGSIAGKGVWGVGDSVMLGSESLFAAHGWRMNAQVGRQFSAGVPILTSFAGSGSMPRNVVISLGTNGTISPSDCRVMVAAAGPARRVFLVNNHAARSWTAGNNQELQRCAAAFPRNRVTVVDWATPADAHPQWFGGDGIHPNDTGRLFYTGLIVSAIARMGI
jgi:hypothetical protein